MDALRIVFWNIMHGGGRSAGAIAEQIIDWKPDIVALAEYRGTAPSQSIARRLGESGYIHQLATVNSSEPTRNALFLASRFELALEKLDEAPEPDLYWLFAHVQTRPAIHVAVVHAPWAIRYGRLEYYAALAQVAQNWRFGPGLIIGDTNSALTGLDEETEDSACYHERVTNPLAQAGWREMFRYFNPDADAPTWYSIIGTGRRLDQAYANAALQPLAIACRYEWVYRQDGKKLSDHAALLLDLDLGAATASA